MKLVQLIDALGSGMPGHSRSGRHDGLLTMGAVADGLGGLGLTSTAPNILGGQDIFHNGVKVESTAANIFGGFDHHTASGASLGHSSANILGGFDYQSASGSSLGHSSANIFGGHDISGAHGAHLGTTMPEHGGMSIHDPAGGVHHLTHNIHGGWDSNDV